MILLAIAPAAQADTAEKNATLLSPSAFQQKLKHFPGEPQVVDLRTLNESGGETLSVIPWLSYKHDRVVVGLDMQRLEILHKQRPLFLIDLDGSRIDTASKKLMAEGFDDVIALQGGVTAWKRTGLPVWSYWRKHWEDLYSSPEYFYGVSANEFFTEQLSQRKPGKLLLPGEGEGRNAVYAAKHGWTVDAFDLSTQARRKALLLAKQSGVSINYRTADFGSPHLPPSFYDMAAIIDLPVPKKIREAGVCQVARSLRKGGLLIIETPAHGSLPKYSKTAEDMTYSSEEIKSWLPQFKLILLNNELVTRNFTQKSETLYVTRLVAIKM